MPKIINWTPEQILLLGTMSDAAVAKILNIALKTVTAKRKSFGIEQFKLKRGPQAKEWTPEMIAQLGKQSDTKTALLLGVSKATVVLKRNSLNIEPKDGRKPPWTPEHLALLGKTTDYEVAQIVGKSRGAVVAKRTEMGIPAFLPSKRRRSRIFMDWSKFALLEPPELFSVLKEHYMTCFARELNYPILAKLTFYSESRMQKWFTPGSAQQPLSMSKRHHFWLLGQQWGAL